MFRKEHEIAERFANEYACKSSKLFNGTGYSMAMGTQQSDNIDAQLKDGYYYCRQRSVSKGPYCLFTEIHPLLRADVPLPHAERELPFAPPPSELLNKLKHEVLPSEYEGLAVRVLFSGTKKKWFGLVTQPYSIEIK